MTEESSFPDEQSGSEIGAGSILSGYKLLEEIGRSNSAIVYKAFNLQLQNTVCVKILADSKLLSEESKQRFFQEIKALSLLEHPNIVQVFGAGVERARPFLVMEYIEGESLARAIELDSIDQVDALRIAAQISDGLSYVHSKGIVHRDIKPGNIMISSIDKSARLIDFGIAKAIPAEGSSAQGLTREGHFVGSLIYASPEQIRGEKIDTRSDVYSLGLVLYEMLAKKPPFVGNSEFELSAKHMDSKPAEIAGVSKELNRFLQKALMKKAADRFQSMDEFKSSLPPADKARPASGKSKKVVLLALAFFLLAGIVAFVFANNREPIRSGGRAPASLSGRIKFYETEYKQFRATGIRSLEYYRTCKNLADCYRENGELRKAVKLYQDTLESISVLVSNEWHTKREERHATGEIAHHADFLNLALSMVEALPPGTKCPGGAHLMFVLGEKSESPANAEKCFRYAVALWAPRGSQSRSEYGRYLENLARILYDQHRFKESEPIAMQGIQERCKADGVNTDGNLHSLARVYCMKHRRNDPDAEAVLERFKSVLDFHRGSSKRHCVDSLIIIGQYMIAAPDKKDRAAGRAWLKEAIELSKEDPVDFALQISFSEMLLKSAK